MNRKSLSEDLPENVKYRKKGDVPLVLSLEIVVTATPQRMSFICVSCEQCNLDLKPQMHRCYASAHRLWCAVLSLQVLGRDLPMNLKSQQANICLR